MVRCYYYIAKNSSNEKNNSLISTEGESSIVKQMNNLGTSAAENRKYDQLKAKREGLFLEAVLYLEQLVKINPNNADVLTTLENIYRTIGDVQNYKRINRMR